MDITEITARPLRILTRKPHMLLTMTLIVGLMVLMSQSAWSASISGPTLLDVSGKYVGGTNGIDGTSWTSLKTDFAYRLGGTAVGKNNRNTPNASGDTTGTLDPNLNSVGYFRMAPGGTLTISGTFAAALTPSTFSTYGGQYLSVGLINRSWINNAKAGFNSDMRTSSAGPNGNAYLIFYKESVSTPALAAMEEHSGGRATATDRRDIGLIATGVVTFSVQFQAGVDKNNNPVATGGRMRYSLNNGAYGPWDNNSHDFVGQDTTLQLTAFTSLGYPFSATIGTVGTNSAPLANDDSYSVNEDATLTVTPAGVLANDSDPDGDPCTALLVSGPSNGTLTFNADGSFSYTPNANFNGADSFIYRAVDSKGADDPATVRITVVPVNDAPTAGGDSYSTPEDTPLNVNAPGLLANDSDPDAGDTLSAVLVSGPSNGTLTLNSNGSFSYTPNANYNGPDSFSYRARDAAGATSAPVTVTITVTPVNDPPTAAVESYSTAEDTPLTVNAPGVLANDSDPEGAPLTAVLASGPSNGALTLNADGSFSYTPNANFNGADSFSYQARDSGGATSAPTTVTITVTPVNDVPSAAPNSYSTGEDRPLTISAPGVLANDSNPDGGAFSAVLVSGPSNGTLTLNSNGSFTYTPNANFNGADSFSYKARDAQADESAPATVTITVTPINDAPSFAKGPNQTVAEDSGPQSVAGWATSISAGPANEATQTVTFLVTNNNNTLFSAQPAIAGNGTLTFTPAPNANGSAIVTVRLKDNGGVANGGVDTSAAQTFTITVTPVNDPPAANDDVASVGKNSGPNPINVLANDTIAPDTGETLTITSATQGANGSVAITGGTGVTYRPRAGFSGADSFTYTISDGNGGTDTATVRVTVSDFHSYLPQLIGPPAPAAQPDLVGSFTLNPTNPAAGQPVTITVRITNQGSAPASNFWVDFYIDPTTPPTAANQPWNRSCGATQCPYGIAWYISSTVGPGQSITVTSTAGSYFAKNTIWPGFFVGGTHNLYLYVDSWNPTVASGAVAESNETNNRAERLGLVVSGTIAVPPGPQQVEDLPERPVRPDAELR